MTIPLNTAFSDKYTSYTITAASAEADVDHKMRVNLTIKAESTFDYGSSVSEATFRLRTGSDVAAPVTCTCGFVDAHSTRDIEVTFVIPDTATEATSSSITASIRRTSRRRSR